MEFSMPLSVSVGRFADRVIIFLAYVDPNTDKLTFDKVSGDIPMLLKTAEELESLKAVAGAINNTSRSLFYIFLVCNILFSFALGQLWGTFQTL